MVGHYKTVMAVLDTAIFFQRGQMRGSSPRMTCFSIVIPANPRVFLIQLPLVG